MTGLLSNAGSRKRRNALRAKFQTRRDWEWDGMHTKPTSSVGDRFFERDFYLANCKRYWILCLTRDPSTTIPPTHQDKVFASLKRIIPPPTGAYRPLLFQQMDLQSSQPYANFRAWVPRNTLPIGLHSPKKFTYYSWGPRSYPEPILCLHSLLGSAEVFFHQLIALPPRGYRILSLDLPSYQTILEFCDALHAFLDTLAIQKIHIVATGLGGYLALHYAHRRPDRVMSLFLIHSFLDTTKLNLRPPPPPTLRWLPDFFIKGIIRSIFPRGRASPNLAKAAEFAIAQTLSATREKLVSRLALSAATTSLVGRLLPEHRITLLDTLDRPPAALTLSDLTAQQLPGARRALLNTGADFPYLSVPDDVNIHLLVHLRRYAADVTEKTSIPPPARPRPIVGKPVAATERGRTKAEAEAVVAAESKALVEKYAFEIGRLREVLPGRDDDFLAAVMDNAGELEDALRKADEGLYDDKFYENVYNKAMEGAMRGDSEEGDTKERQSKPSIEKKEVDEVNEEPERPELGPPGKAELSPVASPETDTKSPRRRSCGEDELVGRGPAPFGGVEGEWARQVDVEAEGDALFEWKGVFGDSGDADDGDGDNAGDEWEVFRVRSEPGDDPLDASNVEIRDEAKTVTVPDTVDELEGIGLNDDDGDDNSEEDRLRAWSMSATAASKTIHR